MASADVLGVLWNLPLDPSDREYLQRNMPLPLSSFHTLAKCKGACDLHSFGRLKVISFLEVRLPTMVSADCAEENEQDILEAIFVHLRGDHHLSRGEWLSRPYIYATGRGLQDYARVGVHACVLENSTDVFGDLDRLSFHRLFELRDLRSRVQEYGLLGVAADWHRSQIQRHAGRRHVKIQSNDYNKDVNRCDAALKSVQRLIYPGDICSLDGIASNSNGGLVQCSLQLGYADVAEVLHSGDSCATCKKKISTGALLKEPCSAGTSSFKPRMRNQVRKNGAYPPKK